MLFVNGYSVRDRVMSFSEPTKLDDGQPVTAGEPGRVVVTDLTGRTMPFIRYDHGDQAVFKIVKDKDGNEIRRLTRILGRDDDYALLPDGSINFFKLQTN